MPALLVSKIAEKTGIPLPEAEHRWKHAKAITHDEKNLNPSDGDAYRRYVTAFFKKSMGFKDGAVLESIDSEAHKAATSPKNNLPEPTLAQIESGNYKKGHISIQGLKIAIENPKGSRRRGVSKDGKAWESLLHHHYGYIKGSVGADKDHIDVFIGDKTESPYVFVVNQVDPGTGRFDEHKVMIGFEWREDAIDAYLSNYEKGWKGLGSLKTLSMADFKDWLETGNTKMVLESTVQPNQKPTVSQDQSRKAMKFTLDTQKNTMEGAHRPDAGWIAFLWGNPGREPLFADGDGLARIIAKQDFEKKYLTGAPSGRELCMRLVDIVTRGYVKRKYGPSSRPKIDFSWQGEVATVSWEPARKTWYLSAWREDWGGVLESAGSFHDKQPWEMTSYEITQSSLRLSYKDFSDQVVIRLNHKRIADGRPSMNEKDELSLRQQAAITSRKNFTDPIMVATSFQDIADVFGKVFDVYLDDGPVMEAALYESAKTGDFVMSPNGTINFGQITPEIAKIIMRQPGFIRMRPQQESHIETNRNTQLDRPRFDNVVKLVYEIAQKYNRIYEGRGRSLILAETSGKTLVAYIELEPGDGSDFYAVKSALSSRSDYLNKKKKLWDRAQSYHLYEETPSAISGQSCDWEQLWSDPPYHQRLNLAPSGDLGHSNYDKIIESSDDAVNKIFEGAEDDLVSSRLWKPVAKVDQAKIDAFFDYGQLGDVPEEAIRNIKMEVNRLLPGALRQDTGPLYWSSIGALQNNVQMYLRRFWNGSEGEIRQKKDRFLAPILTREWADVVAALTSSDVIDTNVGDVKIKVSTEWKDKINAANSFDDIYLAFKSAGLLTWRMPADPATARKVFEAADWAEVALAEFNANSSAVGRLEISERIYKQINMLGTDKDMIRRLVPGYDILPYTSQLVEAAGKEVFETAKAKGASIVEAWLSGPERAENREEVAAREKALVELKAQQKEAERQFYSAEKAIQDRTGYTQAHADCIKAMDDARANEDALFKKLNSVVTLSAEWHIIKGQYDEARAAYSEAGEGEKWAKILTEVSNRVYDSEEYKTIRTKFGTISRIHLDQRIRLREEIKDLDKKLYGSLISKILDSSPISENQAAQWSAEQIFDKSALTTLKKQGYLEADIRKDMAELYRLSGGRFGKCHLLPRRKGQSRACAEVDGKKIHIGAEFTKRTLWHEMGHLFEADPKYKEVSFLFLDGRIDKSKGLRKLSSITGNKNYRKSEVAYTDHLFNPYVGKYYGGHKNVSEVLSMGIQQFSSPELMAELEKSDPEMFHLITGLLATPPTKSEREVFGGEIQKAKAYIEASKQIDEFYKMLDKKIKKNPDFYKPFAEIRTYGITRRGRRTGTAYNIISNSTTADGYSEFSFSAKSKSLVLQLAYLHLLLKQFALDGATEDFKRWGQYNVINKDSIPTSIPPAWITDGIPDIKAA